VVDVEEDPRGVIVCRIERFKRKGRYFSTDKRRVEFHQLQELAKKVNDKGETRKAHYFAIETKAD